MFCVLPELMYLCFLRPKFMVLQTQKMDELARSNETKGSFIFCYGYGRQLVYTIPVKQSLLYAQLMKDKKYNISNKCAGEYPRPKEIYYAIIKGLELIEQC